MNDRTQTLAYVDAARGGVASQEQRNRVLRNTYWLLALSLLPTVLGAWLGVATGVTRGLSGGLGLVVFLGGAFGFMFAIEKTKNSAAGVFFVMATLASVIKRDLSGLGKWLFVGALVVMVGAIVNVFVGSTVGMLVISTLVIGVFSLYMLYDLKRIIDGGETNYISATLALYLDLFNVFQGLLALLGLGGSSD